MEAAGTAVPEAEPKEGDASEKVDDRARRVAALRAQLLTGVPEAPADQNDEQHARWLLAYCSTGIGAKTRRAGGSTSVCAICRRRTYSTSPGVAGLEHVERVELVPDARTGSRPAPSLTAIGYPVQEMEIRRKDELKLKDGKKFGDVVAVDRIALHDRRAKGADASGQSPHGRRSRTRTSAPMCSKRRSFEIGRERGRRRVSAREGPARFRRAEPATARVRHGCAQDTSSPKPDEPAVDFAVRIAGDLDDTVLAIQGPPGSGKTYSGARDDLRTDQARKEGRRHGDAATR